ncbi:hypothetical protein D8Y22_12260 [Salinadaptatus halalkaliphilus]|uniref:Uncharacterized protein n=1 Tax=Salinadaptatus halalkaliphilus TaxID=2419781 RepID=A0A4S3TKE3_9EURY|nr:hypothetical protein D8Y22_12260 [Salinadaptatus halalkaliphilus]
MLESGDSLQPSLTTFVTVTSVCQVAKRTAPRNRVEPSDYGEWQVGAVAWWTERAGEGRVGEQSLR